MKKKIICVAFCLILFLIFTALSFGDIDPKYKARGHPWDHMLSPPVPEDTTVQAEASVFLIPFNFNALMMFWIDKNLSLTKDIDHSSSILHKKKWVKGSKNILKR